MFTSAFVFLREFSNRCFPSLLNSPSPGSPLFVICNEKKKKKERKEKK